MFLSWILISEISVSPQKVMAQRAKTFEDLKKVVFGIGLGC